jgi:Ca-activated chloride channel homolog
MSLSWARPELLLWMLAVPLVTVLPPVLLRHRLRMVPARAILRSVILTLLIITLAGPMMLRAGAESTTFFLVDRSGSVQPGPADAAQQWMEDAIGSAGGDDEVMVADFGGTLQTRIGPAPAAAIDAAVLSDASELNPESTDLTGALSHAASLPVGGMRVVLVSDGAETTGQAAAEIEALRAAGIPVDVIPLPGVPEGELRLTGLSGPSLTWAGANEQVTAYVAADRPGTAVLELSVDGEVTSSSTVSLGAEGGAVRFDLPDLGPGYHVIEIGITESELPNAIGENDRWPLGVFVRDAPRVAIVSPEGGDSGRLERALHDEGLETETLSSPSLLSTEDDLAQWDAIVLDNVPAWDIDVEAQEALAAYARAGGGVAVLGGTASFGPGAYAATPLEAMLPLTVKVTDGRDRPRVTVLLVIDRSGSMSTGESTGGAPKIVLARDSVVTAASALVSGDQVGVIAFNDEPVWALPMMTISGENPEGAVAEAIGELHAEGGTEIFPAMQVAVDGIRNVDTDVRHIILLSDGRSRGAQRDSYLRLMESARAEGITVSTLGLGYDADVSLLEDMAHAGAGRYHFVSDDTQIPRITFEEARAAGSQSVLRGDFVPVQLAPSPIMADVDAASLPPLDGYNFAGARPGAQVVLASDRRDPLLAKWQFGLGRVVAWTGDSGADFAAGWSGWDGYDRFWGNVIGWALPDPTNLQYAIEPVVEGDSVRLRVMEDANGSPAPPSVTVTVRDAGGDVLAGPVDGETYRALVVEAASGPAWQVEINDGTVIEHHAVTLAPSAEWQPSPGGHDLLARIADGTGGRVLSLDDEPGAVFDVDRPDRGRQEAVSVWWAPAAIALALFLADIAVRLGVTFRRR